MTTGRRPTLLLTLALAATIVAACGSGDGHPVATAEPVTTPAATGASSTSESATATPASDPTAAAVTSTTMTTLPNPAAATTAAPATTATGLAASTTLGDLLTEDEVAEVERALDELDALLGEIDADLAGAPDP